MPRRAGTSSANRRCSCCGGEGRTARGEALTGDADVQARAILDLIAAALAEAGAAMHHVVRIVVDVTDFAFQQKVARAHGETVGAIRPASTLVQFVALRPGAARVEIEATAIITGRASWVGLRRTAFE